MFEVRWSLKVHVATDPLFSAIISDMTWHQLGQGDETYYRAHRLYRHLPNHPILVCCTTSDWYCGSIPQGRVGEDVHSSKPSHMFSSCKFLCPIHTVGCCSSTSHSTHSSTFWVRSLASKIVSSTRTGGTHRLWVNTGERGICPSITGFCATSTSLLDDLAIPNLQSVCSFSSSVLFFMNTQLLASSK